MIATPLHVKKVPSRGLYMPDHLYEHTRHRNIGHVGNEYSDLIPDSFLETVYDITGMSFPRNKAMWNEYKGDWSIAAHRDSSCGAIAVFSWGAPADFRLIEWRGNRELSWEDIRLLDQARVHKIDFEHGDMIFVPSDLQDHVLVHAVRGHGRRRSLVLREHTDFGLESGYFDE